VPAGALLLLGLYAGLVLIGLPLPALADRLAELHAPLLVFGFVGTLIALERAVALARRAWFAAPALLAAGALLCLAPVPLIVGQAAVSAGLLIHVLQYVAIWRRQAMTATAVQSLGAVTALAAALAWCGGTPPTRLVPMLACFLILAIAGERLELARLNSPGLVAERLLFIIGLSLAASTTLALTMPVVAIPMSGAVLLGLVAWLLRYDVARVTVRSRGLPRFAAACLLAGYAWLGVAGAGWLLGGARTEGAVYDATTHAIFLGFVITMIMAHAPIILPAVIRVDLPYHPVLYAPVALLQFTLLVRVVAGDAWGMTTALQIGGLGAAIAIVLFFATSAALAVRGTHTRASEKEAHHVTA
jgi:hypothetical protein